MAAAAQSSASPATPWAGDAGRSAVSGVIPPDLRERADALRAGRTPFVVATVVRAERPTSAKAGDRALILPDGALEGFVGGTCAESTVRQYGLRLLSGSLGRDSSAGLPGEPRSTLLRIEPEPGSAVPEPGRAGDDPAASGNAEGPTVGGPSTVAADRDGVVTVANPCLSGGTLEIFLESVIPPPRVHVLGAAPIAQALVRIGAALGYDIAATTDPATPLARDTAAVVVASHGRDEEAMLAAALDATDEERARVRTPAGLDIGARTAPEIALSILAEIVAARALAADTAAGSGSAGTTEAARPTAADAAGPAQATDSLPTTAVDPVCGMTVEVTPRSLRYEYDGTTYYFCGAGCRQAFAADPAKYL